MANPVFHSQTSGSVTVGNEATSHTVTLPSSIATGDLLLLLVVTSHDFDDLSVSGWTRYSEFVVNGGLSSGCFFAVYAKTAGASESNPDITLGSSGLVSWICQRWSNAQFDNASSIYLDTIGSLSTTSDPSTPYPPSTSDDFYQLAVSFWADESDISSYPSGYGNTVSTASTVIGIGSATKLVSTIEDPGAFTLTDAVENVAAAFLIISLDAATGSGTVDGTGVLIGVGTTDRAGTGIISGIGDLDGIGHTDHSGTGTITCTGDISGIGDTDHRGSGVIPCTGELDGIGYTPHRGSGSISGTATITGIGSSGSDGTGIITGTGILSGTGLSHYIGSGTISGTGSLSGVGDAPGIGPNMGSGVISGTGTSSAIGYREPLGSGTISGTGTLTGQAPITPGSGGKHMKCCCPGSLCEDVTELWNTGEEYTGTNIEGYSDPHGPCAVDDHWTANGGPAYVIKIYQDGVSEPDDRTAGEGCAYEAPDLLAITSVCSVDIYGAPLSGLGKAVVEPGGPDGAEVVFECDFEIPAGVNLYAIAFCGLIATDNYVKVGEWKVNGIDQAHINHGTYDQPAAGGLGNSIDCRTYGFTKETANLVHGTNHIAITVKNGNLYSDPGFGGPLFLQMTINCLERLPCDINETGWFVRVGDEIGVGDELNWARIDENEDPYDCFCYCKEGGPPDTEPLYPGQTEQVPCAEAHI